MTDITVLSSSRLESRWAAESVAHSLGLNKSALICVAPTHDGSGTSLALDVNLGVSRRQELDLAYQLQHLESEVLVCTDPALLSLAAERLPTRTALVAPRLDSWTDEELEVADSLTDLRFSSALETWDSNQPETITLWASSDDVEQTEVVIRCFIEARSPAQVLRVGTCESAVSRLRRFTDSLGVHGLVQIFDLAEAQIDVRNFGSAVIAVGHETPIARRLVDAARAHTVPLHVFSGDVPRLESWVDSLVSGNIFNEPDHAAEYAASSPEQLQAAVLSWINENNRRHNRFARLTPSNTPDSRTATEPTKSPSTPPTDHPQTAQTKTPNPENRWAASPDTIRWGGIANSVRGDCSEPSIIEENAALASTVLSERNIQHLLLNNDFEPKRFAVAHTDADRVFSAIRDNSFEFPVYVESLNDKKRVLKRQPAPLLDPPPGTVALRVFKPVITPGKTLRFTGVHGATIEIWSENALRKGFASPYLASPRGAHISSLSSNTSVSLGGANVPTRQHYLTHAIDEIDFPIDAVWTWVDGSDPQWRAQRNEHSPNELTSSDGNSALRFESRDELKFSLRSVHMYAPWIRKIYIVTAGQKPSWLIESDRVAIVDHREIIDPKDLPTFNSHVIENNLHHIEGLSEQFLYFNDDVFLGRRTKASDFFTSSGQSKVFPSPTGLPEGPIDEWDHAYYAARKNNRDLLRERFDREVVFGYLHTPHSMQRKLMFEIETEFAFSWGRTNSHRFRSDLDIATASSLHHDYGKLIGRAVNGRLSSRYIRIGTPESLELFRALLARRYLDVFCVNDTRDAVFDPTVTNSSVDAFLSAYFPVKAPWEAS